MNSLGRDSSCVKTLKKPFFFLFQRKEYVKYAKVFPLAQALDIKIPAKWYRRVIGGLELVCGLAMALVPIGMESCYIFIGMSQILLRRYHHFS